ncbi:MAG: hypothetical protein J2P51_06455, partial [Hyphomicrobiaceae bacterium]|nr:hypothetical protein [Hyphomicrobiaceae bacterium]
RLALVAPAIPDAARTTSTRCTVPHGLLREKFGIMVVRISNGGFAGYGPGGPWARSLHTPGAGAGVGICRR